MNEILNLGSYGRLVKEPRNSKSWELAIQQEVEKYTSNNLKNVYLNNIPESVYDYKDWSTNLLNLITNKKHL